MPAASFTKPLLGAVFLACSWTWVIGMWFPVYLIRDFGWPGWLVFAIPNCLGAMSVGFVLANPDRLRRFWDTNYPAIFVFSIVTLAFHAFVLSYMLVQPLKTLIPASVLIGLAVVFVPGLLLLPLAPTVVHRLRNLYLAAAATLLCSGIASLFYLDLIDLPPATGSRSQTELLYASFPIVLGFLTCPFLDATFLKTRAVMRGASGKLAFVLSFAFLFPLLVLLTMAYATDAEQRQFLPLLLLLHFIPQCVLTSSAHIRESTRMRMPDVELVAKTNSNHSGKTKKTPGVFLYALVASALIGALISKNHFELAYQLFLSFYALIFPAWIWCVSIPHPTLRNWSWDNKFFLFLATTILAAPLFALGYFADMYILLPPAVLAVLAMPYIAAVLPLPKQTTTASAHE